MRDAAELLADAPVEVRSGDLGEAAEALLESDLDLLPAPQLAHRLTRLATAPRVVRPLRNLALRLLSLVPAFRRRLAEQLSAIGHG